MNLCLDPPMADKKPQPKSATVRIDDDLVRMLKTIKFAADLNGERFRVVEFLSAIVRPAIVAAHEKASAIIKKRKP